MNQHPELFPPRFATEEAALEAMESFRNHKGWDRDKLDVPSHIMRDGQLIVNPDWQAAPFEMRYIFHNEHLG